MPMALPSCRKRRHLESSLQNVRRRYFPPRRAERQGQSRTRMYPCATSRTPPSASVDEVKPVGALSIPCAPTGDNNSRVRCSWEQELAAAAQRVAELQARHGALRVKVEGSTATEDELAEYGQLRDRLIAAEQARQNADTQVYRAKLARAEADMRAEIEDVMTKIGALIPKLQWELVHLERLRNGNTVPFISLEQNFGVPFDYSRRLLDAIHDAAPAAEYDIDVVFGGEPAPPKRKAAPPVDPLADAPRDWAGRVHVRFG